MRLTDFFILHPVAYFWFYGITMLAQLRIQ